MTHEVRPGRDLYVVPAAGKLSINGVQVEEGDGVAITNEAAIEFKALADTELVVVELV